MSNPVRARCAKCRQLIYAKPKEKHPVGRVYLVKHKRPSINSPGEWVRCPGSGARAVPYMPIQTTPSEQ